MRDHIKPPGMAVPVLLLLAAQPGYTQKPAGTDSAPKSLTGRKAAAFSLPDEDGRKVDIGRIMGRKPIVLVFYRGVW
ncbi:MAG TPA: hypothetical protein VGM51_04885 [Armatimonadota bacterium]